MNVLGSRLALVAIASAAQLALVPLALAGPISARVGGEEYRLEVAPVDPIDPFRGAYVALDYPGLPQRQLEPKDFVDGLVFVPLERDGDVWVGTRVLTERPTSGPYLGCESKGSRLRCGIESWFLPQDEAKAMELAVSEGRAVATVRVDGRGNAALADVTTSDAHAD